MKGLTVVKFALVYFILCLRMDWFCGLTSVLGKGLYIGGVLRGAFDRI